jgi:DNA-binding transcriptional ArsR family regulator
MSRASAQATVFTAIADPTRRAVLHSLLSGEKQSGDLAVEVSTSHSALSQHLSVLLGAGLVTQRREGRNRIYRLRAAPLKEVFDWVEHFDRFWDEKLDALGRYLEENP